MRRRHGPDHPQVAKIMHHLAEVLWRNGKGAEAESLGREALAMYVDIVDNHAQEHNHAADVLSEILLAP